MAQKAGKIGQIMAIILLFLAKPLAKHGITLVHKTYPPLKIGSVGVTHKLQHIEVKVVDLPLILSMIFLGIFKNVALCPRVQQEYENIV